MTAAASSGTPTPAPPWTCRLSAVVRLGTSRRGPTVLAALAYAQTPVGPYGEALLAELRPPLRITVPWIVVDSAASVAGGREHWGLPKELAQLEVDVGLDRDRPHARVTLAGGSDGLRLDARAFGPRLPVLGAAVLAQPGRGPARLRFRGRARPAVVRATGGPSAGTGPGAVLDGVLRLAAPRP